MAEFEAEAGRFSYLDEGEGEPILLIHGFASNKAINWVYPGWVQTLKRAGRRVIAIDNRGHGESVKFYDPQRYAADAMAGDALALLDHLGIGRADVMGYSMGARITSYLCLLHPERVRTAVLGGLGYGLVTGGLNSPLIAEGLEAASLDEVTDPQAIAFRRFADQTRSDRRALAACIRGPARRMAREDIATIEVPILIAVGSKDDVSGSPEDLAAILPDAEVLDIPGRDHMLAVGDKVYKEGVLAFLERRTS